MSFFKKIKELFDKPDVAPTHGDWFYHTKLVSKKLIIFYRYILNEVALNKVMKTGEPITPPELNFSLSVNDVINKWGSPRCAFNNKDAVNNIQIFFYRKNIAYENTLFQLQFFNNQLFFVRVEIGKTMMNEESKIAMLTTLLPNLITPNFKSVKEIPTWSDTNNNYLLIEDEVNLNICYLSGYFVSDNIAQLEQGTKKIALSDSDI